MSSSSSGRIRARLPRSVQAASTARAVISEHFSAHLSEERLADAKLVASELASNAYQHGVGKIEMTAALTRTSVRIEMVDEGQHVAFRIPELADSPGGRGLRIIDAIAMEWGAFEGTTHVWAELAR